MMREGGWGGWGVAVGVGVGLGVGEGLDKMTYADLWACYTIYHRGLSRF